MISVVIPLYNKEQSIIRTLDSVLAQTYTDYECIIVNDGSTDQSQQVVKDYLDSQIANNKFQIRLVYQPNAGVSAARNRGIAEAKGEYIAFLDADDLWHPTYLEELAKLIVDYPNVGLYALGYKSVSHAEFCTEDTQGDWERGIITDPWNGNLNVWTGSSCANRELLLQVGGFDTRMAYGEDLDMWWRLLLEKGGAQYAKPLAFYVQDSENRVTRLTMPLEKHIPFFMDKYDNARSNNVDFRKFFDMNMVYRLYPYLFDRKYRQIAYQLSKKIDYSQLKWTMHFRMVCPYIYRLYERLK